MRLQIVAAVLLIATSNATMIQVAGHDSDTGGHVFSTLESLRHQYRPLVVFAPTDNDERLLKQVRGLADSSVQLHDRQVVFVPLSYKKETESSVTTLNGIQLAVLSEDGASKARRRFGVAPAEFTVILIGKDGGEKFRTHTPVTIERLNAVIDAMPMRQQEVRDGNSK